MNISPSSGLSDFSIDGSSPLSPTIIRENDPLKNISLILESISDLESDTMKIKQQVSSLNSDISGLEESLKASQDKIQKLETDKSRDNNPIVSKEELVSTAKQIKQISKKLRGQKNELAQKQRDLSLVSQQREEFLKDSLDALTVELESFKDSPTFSPDNNSQMFKIEYQLKELLSADLPDKDKYQELFTTVSPLLKQTKEAIKKAPMHKSVKQAASSGQALQSALATVKRLTLDDPIVAPVGGSANKVFLLKESAIKDAGGKAGVESDIADGLLNTMEAGTTLGTFKMSQVSGQQFGMPFSKTEMQNSHELSSLSPTALDKFKQSMSQNDKLILEYVQSTPTGDTQAREQFERFKGMDWYLKLEGEDQSWQKLSLPQLRDLYQQDALPPTAKVGLVENDNGDTLTDHLTQNTLFSQLIQYSPEKEKIKDVFITPILNDSFKRCNTVMWLYTDERGIKQKVDFKTLVLISKEKDIASMNPVPIIRSGKTNPIQPGDLKKALNCQWRVQTPHLFEIAIDPDTYEKCAQPVKNVVAKEFLPMVLLDDLMNKRPKALNKILANLTPAEQVKAIHLLEAQLLDLHGKNLALIPSSTLDTEKFKDISFEILGKKNISFDNLRLSFLNGNITPEEIITFTYQGQSITAKIKDVPDLFRALNVPWEIVVFDTDLSIAESNKVQRQFRGGVEEYVLPLRNCLFQIVEFLKKPLSEEAVIVLINKSKGKDQNVQDYANKRDAPIHGQLSPKLDKAITKLLAPTIASYSLSEAREKTNPKSTIKDLQASFVEKICDRATYGDFNQLWEPIEKELSFVNVLPGDSYESLAARHHQDVAVLKKLNPNFDFATGKKFKISYDLISDSPEAVKKREKIAGQFFPRLTSSQLEALIKRQVTREIYLHKYVQLSESTATGQALVNQIEAFLMINPSLFSFTEYKQLLKDLKKEEALITQGTFSPTLSAFKKKLLERAQPTFSTLANVMYPLLADVRSLNTILTGDEATAGKMVGLYNTPIKDSIKDAQTRFPAGSEAQQLADHIDEQIKDVTNPSFFGYWG